MAFEIAASLDEIEVGATLLVELAEPVCPVRLDDDDVRAIHDTCTHQQQPLHEGMVVDDTLVCAAHAATFDLASGESIGVPVVSPIAVYACTIEDGCVLVDLRRRTNDTNRGSGCRRQRCGDQLRAAPVRAPTRARRRRALSCATWRSVRLGRGCP